MQQSPLLNKAKEITTTRRTRIPRKGRIRAALIMLAVIIGARILFFRGASPPSASQARSPNEIHQTNGKAAQTEGAQAVGANRRKHTKKARSLSYSEVSSLLRKRPPRLDRAVDTLFVDRMSLVFYYSIDTALQQTARKLMKRYHPVHGAVVAVDPRSGRVLAFYSYDNPADSASVGKGTCTKSIFPAASIFKTITAAGAIEMGRLSAESKLKTLGRNHTLYKYQLEPELERFREISLGEAFAYSINPVFGRLGLYTLKSDGIRKYGDKFGFGTPIPFELPAEAPFLEVSDSAFLLAELASGFNQRTRISPLFGSLIAAAICSDGLMPAPMLVDSVVDLNTGNRCYTAAASAWRQPISATTARHMQKLMNNVTRYGTARKSFRYVKRSSRFTDILYGGKTGNVDMDTVGRTDWFVGFAKHAIDSAQRIATGVVTVHGPYWTVHSSFIGAEIIRHYIRNTQIRQHEEQKLREAALADADTTSPQRNSGS